MRRIQNGSAFVELLIAVFVVTLLVLSIVAVSPMTTRMQTQARQYTYATNVAQTVLERLRTQDFLQVTAGGLLSAGIIQSVELDEPNRFIGRFTTVAAPGGGTVELATQLPNVSGTIEVFNETTNNNISTGVKRVFVTIRWQEPRTGRWQQVQLATIVVSLN